jgi:glutamate racemase
MDKRPIGVFDSGVGGMTIVEEMMDRFPNEDIIYIADTINNPYGDKSKDEIMQIVTNVASYLESCNVKIIVIACNTATIYSQHLHSILNIPFIGVVHPTAKTAFRTSDNNQILILATQATIASNVYQEYLKKKDARYIALATPEFVEMIEQGQLDSPQAMELVERTLAPYRNSGIDTVLLGCTHFGLLEPLIEKILPNINLVDSANALCEVLESKLDLLKLRNDSHKIGTLNIIVTGDLLPFQHATTWFKKPIDHISTHIIKK